ncbi:DUF948 domain-containing protein [Peribacillus sp. NJ4]|uniref:DUF948 domain-containing protein n=1 Tax=Peribacillus TaxID=2675229 RepID=UPI0025A1BA80|nr:MULTISPECIES: DUF948 domain-containing protein [unclassified Peribacillus]MDM5211293.1 DUF948 domain-containing protein [Peribacillus sp. NJ4]MDM5221604.1 DUF948 domain-containing protein [Peribacillus sp. NJ11]
MEIILYLSAAVAAIAFLVLVIFLTKVLTSLQTTLDSVARTLTGLESQMQGITLETTQLLHKTNTLAEDLQHKSENLNTVVDAVKDVGTSISSFNSSIQKVSHKVQAEIDNNQERISQIVQWSNVAMEIRDKWKARSKQAAPTPTERAELEREALETDNLPKKRFLRSRS